MKNDHELTELLNKIVPINMYKGCLVKKLIGGYEVLGHKVKTPSEVDEVIDESLKSMAKNIFK